MRCCPLAFTLLLVPRISFASTFAVSGSVLRVDEGTYRVELAESPIATTPNAPGDCPEGFAYDCCYPTFCGFQVSGSFGLPTNVTGGSGYDQIREGFISWGAGGLQSFEVQFDFAASPAAPSSMVIDFEAAIFWFGRCEGEFGDFELDPIDSPGSGRLYADLPARVGDSATLREIPVAVKNRPWGAVKQLYR